jgi:hypothetical protein
MRKMIISLVLLILLGLLVILALSFRHHENHPSDALISHELLGTWSPQIADGRSRTFILDPDGNWTATVTGKIRTGHMQGTWLVSNDFLVTVMTTNDLDMQVPHTSKNHIIRMDSQEFVIQVGNSKTIYNRLAP